MWILLDNYDSFTHILHHYLMALHEPIIIVKNDEYLLHEFIALDPECIILGPGPKRPEDAGILMEVVEEYLGKIPLLGVCLGHQALGTYLGGSLEKAIYPMHGKTSSLTLASKDTYWSVLENLEVMRYHSLIIKNLEQINSVEVLAYAKDDQALMLFKSEVNKCFGIQFHPESIGTKDGAHILDLWFKWAFK